jgi:hypothetical protein
MLIECPIIAGRPKTCRSKTTNKPSKMVIDGRSPVGRRVRDIAEAFATQMGGWAALSDMQAAAVRRAAELHALAEQARADALKNGNADPEQLVRLENLARKAEHWLGIKPKGEPKPPNLDEYLAQRAREAAGA